MRAASFGRGLVVFGLVLYYNGNGRWDHNFYTANDSTPLPTGRKHYVGNVAVHQSGNCFQLYGTSDSFRKGFVIDRNMCAGGAEIQNPASTDSATRHLIVGGGGDAAEDITVTDNDFWHDADQSGGPGEGATTMNLGCYGCGSSGIVSPTVTGNFARGDWYSENLTGPSVIGGSGALANTFVSGYAYDWAGGDPIPASVVWPDNSWTSTHPDTCRVKSLVPQAINGIEVGEAGRAALAIWNGAEAPTVSCDVSSVLAVGSTYEVRTRRTSSGARS